MYALAKRESENREKPEKEAIHSGHFMVSHFEAEEQDDEYEVAVPIPEVIEVKEQFVAVPIVTPILGSSIKFNSQQQLAIDTSLSKLFQCMSIAYRQKLTSPKWNRFRGIRLRWKDKIRLNNVIWRCWHMQFIKKISTLICPFASPLDVDTHNKPEAVVLEGKYWKRKLAAVTAEYKKWRMYYRNQVLGHAIRDTTDTLSELDALNWHSQSSENMHMLVDEDYMGLMSDTLFSTISNQPFVFPDSREIAKAGLADFIQPSLGPLQPNLDDYMDTFEPLQEFICGKLPTVPEEHGTDSVYKNQQIVWNYVDLDLMAAGSNLQLMDQYQVQSIGMEKHVPIQDTRQTLSNYNNEMMIQTPLDSYATPVPPPLPQQQPPPAYPSSVISKNDKQNKSMSSIPVKMEQNQLQNSVYNKQMDSMYQSYTIPEMHNNACSVDNRLQIVGHQTHQQQQIQSYKLPQPQPEPDQQASQGYKFPAPAAIPPNVKFTSQPSNNYKSSGRMHMTNQMPLTNFSNTTQKEVKTDNRGRGGATRGSRQRSVSNSREPVKRPPLITAISDPALISPTTSVLLTQLLTNNTQTNNIFLPNQSLGAVGPAHDQQSNSVHVKEENATIPLLQHRQSAPATLIITTPVSMNPVQSSVNDPLLLHSLNASNSNSPVNSQGSPTSPQGALDSPTRESSQKDQRRVGHIHAEQKRRYNIKNGFDMIHSLIPHLNQNPNAKLSKAAMLQKGAEYIRQLRQERNQLKDEMDSLRQQIETLNTSISNCQSLLPATGAPVSRRRDSKMQEMFDDYVRKRTMEDWKFWIFSLLFRPLLVSFNNFVSTSSMEDLYRSTLLWVEQHCTLGDLRPVVLNSLRYLCTKTDILSEPEKLPDEARQAVIPSSSNNQN